MGQLDVPSKRKSYGWAGLWEVICGVWSKRIIKVLTLGILLTTLAVYLDGYFSGKLFDLLSNILLASGTALIAAAVVGYIFADEDYTKLLEKDIVNVLFNPENYKNDTQLMLKWEDITRSILSKALPFENSKASEKIKQQFLTDERDYHFEGVECFFEFDVNVNTGLVTIKQTITCALVITPNKENPELIQNFSVEDSGELKPGELQLNGNYLNIGDLVKKDPNNSNAYTLKYPLKELVFNSEGRKVVRYKRVMTYEQFLADDPSFSSYISRYVKGYRIEAKITDGYKLLFSSFLGSSIQDFKEETLPEGRVGWTLCDLNDLLLPGEAFILTISKKGG